MNVWHLFKEQAALVMVLCVLALAGISTWRRRQLPTQAQWLSLIFSMISVTSAALLLSWVLMQTNQDLEGLKLALTGGTLITTIQALSSLTTIVRELWARDIQPVPVSNPNPALEAASVPRGDGASNAAAPVESRSD